MHLNQSTIDQNLQVVVDQRSGKASLVDHLLPRRHTMLDDVVEQASPRGQGERIQKGSRHKRLIEVQTHNQYNIRAYNNSTNHMMLVGKGRIFDALKSIFYNRHD